MFRISVRSKARLPLAFSSSSKTTFPQLLHSSRLSNAGAPISGSGLQQRSHHTAPSTVMYCKQSTSFFLGTLAASSLTQVRSFAKEKKEKPKKEPRPKVLTEEQKAKKEMIKSLMAKEGRRKPYRRPFIKRQYIDERKANPPPPGTLLLNRAYTELDKVNAMWGIFRQREPMPPGLVLMPPDVPPKKVKEPKERDPSLIKEPPPRITHQELKQMLDSNESVTIIDLREPFYFQTEPGIPTAHSVPTAPYERKKKKAISERAQFLKDAQALTDAQFQGRYKFPRPVEDTPMVFYSSIGRRSEEVTKYAESLGFNNVKSLVGGIRLWNKYYSTS